MFDPTSQILDATAEDFMATPLSPDQLESAILHDENASLLNSELYDAYTKPYGSGSDYPTAYTPGMFTSDPLRLRASPESSSSEDSQCIPTWQLFEESSASSPVEQTSTPTPTPPVVAEDEDDDDATRTGAKRSSPSPVGPSKKPRAQIERITTKDFVPPDVSGLSKREARLVKNRAAAFLSRQRKREEFETMETRVAELEKENARLRTQATSGAPPDILSEVEQLRAQLAAAEARAGALDARLSQTQASLPGLIKMEPFDDDDEEEESIAQVQAPSVPVAVPRSRSSSVSSQKPDKSAASLGLMVLLCALPSLLSQYAGSGNAPARFSVPLNALTNRDVVSSLHGSAFEGIGFGGPDMDIFSDSDGDMSMSFALPNQDPLAFGAEASTYNDVNTLAFADSAALGLGDLDIAFDTTPSQDGKIRVRIHPQSSQSSRATSPTPSSPFPYGEADPVLGAPAYAEDDDMGLGWGMPGSFDSSFRSSSPSAGKRRVRIALKSMPAAGGEGGEWEVEVC